MTPRGYGAEIRVGILSQCELPNHLFLTGWLTGITFQVSMLAGSDLFRWKWNREASDGRPIRGGRVFGFGLSEKGTWCGYLSNDMILTPKGDGTYVAKGDKYYIGNGIGRDGFDLCQGGRIPVICMVCRGLQARKIQCIQNVGTNQIMSAEYALHDYPITELDILSKGQRAWDDMLEYHQHL